MSTLLNLHVKSVWRTRGQPLYKSLMQVMKLLSARAWMPLCPGALGAFDPFWFGWVYLLVYLVLLTQNPERLP